MKIKTKDDAVIFTPEDDMDCFDLGQMAHIPHKLSATKATDSLYCKIDRFEIAVEDLVDSLTERLYKSLNLVNKRETEE